MGEKGRRRIEGRRGKEGNRAGLVRWRENGRKWRNLADLRNKGHVEGSGREERREGGEGTGKVKMDGRVRWEEKREGGGLVLSGMEGKREKEAGESGWDGRRGTKEKGKGEEGREERKRGERKRKGEKKGR